jgi:hypothetical protein
LAYLNFPWLIVFISTLKYSHWKWMLQEEVCVPKILTLVISGWWEQGWDGFVVFAFLASYFLWAKSLFHPCDFGVDGCPSQNICPIQDLIPLATFWGTSGSHVTQSLKQSQSESFSESDMWNWEQLPYWTWTLNVSCQVENLTLQRKRSPYAKRNPYKERWEKGRNSYEYCISSTSH